MIDVRLVLKRLAITLVILCLAAAAAAWWWIRGSVPSLDADWHLSGLRGPVEIASDAYGVPHAYARDTEDAWFIAGALHARDRLWQMELYRRASQGRLAEILGEAAVPIDQRLLTLGIRAAAEAEWSRVGAPARTALTRYAEGVNAVAATSTGRRRAPELQLLGVTPAPWTPQDSLAIGRLLAFRLAENHGAELVRHALQAVVGLPAADALMGAYPADGPTTLSAPPPPPAAPPVTPTPAHSNGVAASRPRLAEARPRVTFPPALAWLDPAAPRANSNAWVVAPSKTGTGRPLLANDPHLLIEMPSVWYEMHLVAAGLDVQGVSVPGTPFIAIGHNARIAWGFTNTGADVQDLVVERLDLAGKRAWNGSGWDPVRVEAAPIPVRGRATPVPFEVWRTANGVVYADETLEWEAPPGWLVAEGPRSGEQRALVMKWSGFDTGGYADAFEALNRASGWTEFRAAADRLTALSQNAVYADVEGNIGYAMTGQVPVRAVADGSRPLPPGESAWTGVLSGTALPRAFNPASGFIATANNPIQPGSSPFVTRDWAAPFRAAMITRALAGEAKMDVAAASALQLDTRSLAASAVLAQLDAAIAAAQKAGADAAALGLLERLKQWNGVVGGDEATTIYELFENRLWYRVFADDLPDPLFRRFYEWAGGERFAGLYSVLADPGARWWDDIGTIERKETAAEIFVLAAGDAARDFESLGGGSRAWDRVHGAVFSHALGAGGRALAWFFSRGPVPVVGDGTTVMRVSFRRLHGYGAWEYPSWRQVLDVGAWDNSRAVLPIGQSGHPWSPHYFDQNELWRSGQLRPLPYSRGAVDGAARHRLIASP